MNTISKPIFDELLTDYKCNKMFHPWSVGCLEGSFQMVTSCFKGSLVFFSIMYAVTMIFKRQRKKTFYETCKQFIRSVLLGTIQVSGSTYFNCIFRNLTGKPQYYVVGFLSAAFSSSAIFIDHPDRRYTVTTTFLTLAVEGIIRRMVQTGIFTRSRKWETIVFMICNALLMRQILLRLQKNIKTVWFFIPSQKTAGTNSKNCTHDGTCKKEIIQELAKYLITGAIFTIIRKAMYSTDSLKSPLKFFRQFKLESFRLAGFAGAYVGLYKAINCLISKAQTATSDSERAMLSGLVAGCSYWLNPSITVLASLVTILFKCSGEEIKRNKLIPDWPYEEFIYTLSSGFLAHIYSIHPSTCPFFFKYTANTISCNRTQQLVDAIHTELENIIKSKN